MRLPGVQGQAGLGLAVQRCGAYRGYEEPARSYYKPVGRGLYHRDAPHCKKKVSALDGTAKYLVEYDDGSMVECVYPVYRFGRTVCVSSQVGCRMGCSFCASTKGGLVRSLSSGEIIGQVLTVQRDAGERITNVVVMGSGEPMDNFENVVAFIRLLGCLKPFRFRCMRRTTKPGCA